jgi:nitroimidazol reductase NimA-like FMN-containing flavoprotein (pyridoxamine 5'-phosphate oxidase superfamily)
MRRNDKAIHDRETIDGIIYQSEICHLSCCLKEIPYVIPVSFGYDGQDVYIHTAAAGKKITIFEENPQVCLAFVSQVDLKTSPEKACDWSFEFSSVIAEGIISEVTNPKKKSHALNRIMSHYSGKEWDMPEASLRSTRCWKITLNHLTGKISPAPKKTA